MNRVRWSVGKLAAAIVAPLVVMNASAFAGFIDDFSGDLSAYTATRILNNANHSPTNTYAWEISNGAVQINTSAYVGIEQFALTRTDVTLGVGEELKADFSAGYTGSQDIGLYVGAGTPTQDVRADYVNIYRRNNGQLFSRGFNGTSELSLGGGANVTPDTLFIARTAADAYELGYYLGGTRTIVSTRTGLTSNTGGAIGFYADVRSAGIVGNLDNLRIVPEPSCLLMFTCGVFGLSALWRRGK